MTADSWPRQGEIYHVFTPGQPGDPHQPRPALVVSENIRNRRSDDVTVVPIFSRGRHGPTHVAIRAGVGGIAHDSVIFCEEITTIHKDFIVGGPLGTPVPDVLLADVIDAILAALGAG